jgi:hypothetical protein
MTLKLSRRIRFYRWLSPLALLAAWWIATHVNFNWMHEPGDIVDSYNGVAIRYNGAIAHDDGRNLAPDGYNLGLRWQCVEFVKRYYYEHLGHRMPEPRGNARDFFDEGVADGAVNPAHGLVQFRNNGSSLPQVDDIVVFGGWLGNPYGHVAIVSRVGPGGIEIVQQNPGPLGVSREWIAIGMVEGKPRLAARRLLGWLHLPRP